MKRKHKIVIAVVAVLILIIFGVVFCKMERAKMDRTIRNFFMALDQGNFEQLDKIMSEDAYFLQQSVYYYSIRDEMKERWDTIRYTAGEYIIYEYATGY